jgi:ubiquinone/menaquinone biosynthesis C-methylase UbiE
VTRRVDYNRMAAVYDCGRGLPLEALEAWRAALSPYLPPETGMPVLDLGSGTGRFSNALAEWFDADVIGVEPAEGMRREAQRKITHPRVAYIGGEAESIPLRDGSCDSAWLSTVIHHIADLPGCARELRRVLRPHGRVLIRSSFPDRHDDIMVYRFFPAARKIAETFPTVEATVKAFASAGFRMEALESVAQVLTPSLRAFCDRVRVRADSTLDALSDDEFARGMEALEKAAAEEITPTPVVDWLDLLVLR